jgi:hypothetical protein
VGEGDPTSWNAANLSSCDEAGMAAKNGVGRLYAFAIDPPSPPTLHIDQQGATVQLNWIGGKAPYFIEYTETLSPPNWNTIQTVHTNQTTFSITNNAAFYRVRF